MTGGRTSMEDLDVGVGLQAAEDCRRAYDKASPASDGALYRVPAEAQIFAEGGSFAFAHRRGDVLTLAFRGTDDPSDMRLNVRTRMVWFARPVPDAAPAAAPGKSRKLGGVHGGFLTALRRLGPALPRWLEAQCREHPPSQLILTGHSLGGAMATLQAAALNPAGLPPVRLVTFGSPMVGSATFVRRALGAVSSHDRYACHADAVCSLPRHLPLVGPGYRHHGTLRLIDAEGRFVPEAGRSTAPRREQQDALIAHSMDFYLTALAARSRLAL